MELRSRVKIPVFGRIMESFIGKADEFIKERPWLKKLYFTGIVVLVMVPVTGSGGIRWHHYREPAGYGKNTAVFSAIATGAFIGCFGIALATVFLQELFLQSILMGTTAVIVIIVITDL